MEHLRSGVLHVKAAGSAQSLERLLTVCRPVESLAQSLAASRVDAGEALVSYAQEVTSIQDEARRLQACRTATAGRLEVSERILIAPAPDGQTILSVVKSNPSRFNDILDNAIDIKASKWWSVFALADNLIGFDGTSTTAAAFKMYENFRTGEVWDMNVYLTESNGRQWEDGKFMLTDDAGHTVRSDVFGNMNYGAMLARWGVDLDTALRGANACGETGLNNDSLDDRAVEFGYKLHLKYPDGMTERQYSEELANANLY